LDSVGSANGIDARLRKPEVFRFAGSYKTRNCPSDLLDRNCRIDAVLVEKVDRVDA
jgi:hypothetical protein